MVVVVVVALAGCPCCVAWVMSWQPFNPMPKRAKTAALCLYLIGMILESEVLNLGN
jgi:hypothetical protein